MKKMPAAIALLFVFSFIALGAQDVPQQEPSQNQTQEISVASNPSEVPLFGNSQDSTSVADSSSSSGGIFVFLRMILVLAIVCGLIYLFLRFVKKTTGTPETNDQFLRRVSSISLGAGKSVQVISLMDKAWLVGVTDTQINLIAPVEDEELIQAMNLNADKTQNRSRPKSFADVLELFMPSSRTENQENVFASDRANAVEELERTRNRFNESSQGEE